MSTYQAGKVAMIGWNGRRVTLLMREFDKPLGMAVQGDRLALATRHELWIFSNSRLLAHEYMDGQPGRYDALYLPRAVYQMGDLHAHDVAWGKTGPTDLLLVNTRFSCLAKLSWDYHFDPVWRPKFITDLVPEDRCHLNGLTMIDGLARYVTALGTTDTVGGWRANKANGGVLIDVQTQEIVLDGLCMPHSPRWYQGALWLLNSGTGELLRADLAHRQTEVVSRLPGYLRGLCFVGPYALIGLCKIREKHIFGGLPIQQGDAKLLCGVVVVDLRNGAQVAMFEFTAGCEELYDVKFLPGVRQPMIVNLQRPVVHEAVSYPGNAFWLRPSHEVHEAPAEESTAGTLPQISASLCSAPAVPSLPIEKPLPGTGTLG